MKIEVDTSRDLLPWKIRWRQSLRARSIIGARRSFSFGSGGGKRGGEGKKELHEGLYESPPPPPFGEERLYEGGQNCRGAINDEERRGTMQKAMFVREIEILVASSRGA